MTNNVFTVESSNPTKNGNFCNKLVNKSTLVVETDFGKVEQERSKTYYLFTDKQNTKGTSGPLNLAQFDVVTKPYDIETEDGTETIHLDYLYPKRTV